MSYSAGQTLFQGESIVELALQHVNESPRRLRSIRPDVSPATEQLVMKCLEKRPADRFQTAAELKSALNAAIDSPGPDLSTAETVAVPVGVVTPEGGSSGAGHRQTPPRSIRGEPNRTSAWWAAIGVAAVALVAVLAFIVSQLDDADSPESPGPGDEQSELAAPDSNDPAEEPEVGDSAADETNDSPPEDAGGSEEAPEQGEDQSEEAPDQSNETDPAEPQGQQVPDGPGTFTCDGEYAGGTAESLLVPGNATCTLTGVRVDNDLIMQPGASLQATDVEIYGNVQARSVARLELMGTSLVDGNIEFERGGDLAVNGTTVIGNVNAEDNAGSISINGNTVDGNVEIESNTGGITISGNSIDGDLECEDNSPSPTGGDNAVGGEREGQCADL